MSDRPTPETDAFIASQNHSPTTHQLRNFARIFEQERDEAREAIRALAEHGESVIQRITKERDKYKQERDEARRGSKLMIIEKDTIYFQ